jgi:hypothetical protein
MFFAETEHPIGQLNVCSSFGGIHHWIGASDSFLIQFGKAGHLVACRSSPKLSAKVAYFVDGTIL